MDELIAANDPLLRTFIESEGEEARRAALESVLTDRVGPLVRRIVLRQRRYDRLLRGEDAEDISSSVILRLLHRLQRVPFERAAAIVRVDEFAATATFNAIHDFQREQFPEWVKLKRSVRHALSNDARFRTWTSSEYAACGLASWSEGAPGPLPHDWKHHDSTQTAAAIESLLRAAGSPLSIADVVRALADAWQITNALADEADQEIADRVSSHAVALESRNRLAALWRETCALPPAQRTALLLHLRDRDGSSAIALFPLMGIATLDEVAAAIAIPLRELAGLWARLPVDDLTIASLLGVPRQKVINLRAAARTSRAPSEEVGTAMTQHSTAQELHRWSRGEVAEDEVLAIAPHLATCSECRSQPTQRLAPIADALCDEIEQTPRWNHRRTGRPAQLRCCEPRWRDTAIVYEKK